MLLAIRTRRRSQHLALGVLFAIACLCPVNAQTPRATVAGTVQAFSGTVPDGTTVTLTRGNVTRTAGVAADGTFTIDDLPPGVYRAVATSDGYELTRGRDIALIAIPGRVNHVELSLISTRIEARSTGAASDAAVIKGKVVDLTGAAIPGVTLRLMREGAPVLERVADVRGEYRFDALPPGTYRLTESLVGFTLPPAFRQGWTVAIEAGQIVDVSFPLLVSFGSGHGSEAERRRRLEEVDLHLQRWVARRPVSYELDVATQCFGGCSGLQRPLRFRVNGTESTTTDWPMTSWLASLGTAEAIFVRVLEAIDAMPDVFQVTYDPAFGFPSSMRVDPGLYATDDDLEIRVVRFVPIGGRAVARSVHNLPR